MGNSKMHKNKNIRMGISLLLSFFLAAAFFLVYASLVIKIGFLPGNAWQSYLRGSGYGSKMSEEAEEKLTELLETYGLPAGVAEGLIGQETLQMEYSRWLEECWKSEKKDSQNKDSGEDSIQKEASEENLQRREAFEEQLKEQVMTYLANYQIKLTEQLEQEIQAMTTEAGGIYESCLNPSWLPRMMNLQEKYQGTLMAAGVVGLVTAAICILLLWSLYHYKHRAIRFVCFAMEASLAWSALLLVFLGQKGWVAKAGIAPLAYQELVGGLTDIGMQTGLLALGVECVLLILLFIWIKRLKYSAQ